MGGRGGTDHTSIGGDAIGGRPANSTFPARAGVGSSRRWSDPAGTPLDAAEDEGTEGRVCVSVVVVAGLVAEYAGVPELAGPAEDTHAGGVVGGEKMAAVLSGAGHGVGFVEHLPGFDTLCDGVDGVDDVDGKLLIVVVSEAAIGDTDEVGPEGPLEVGEDGVVEEEDALAALAEFFEDGACSFFGQAARHVVEEKDVVGVEYVADVSGPVFFLLDEAIDAWQGAEDGVEAGDVEGVAAGDDGDFDSVVVGRVCAHRLDFPFFTS